jgi:arylsulfatase A-like enzyme
MGLLVTSMTREQLLPAARRSGLKTSGLLLFVWLACLSCPVIAVAARPATRPPNIVFILSDDHRWDFLSCVGHPFVETPSLDRLADEGILFSNTFVTTSLCSPSRASFLTGQYAHTHGVQNNLTPWRDENLTFLELLKKAGYDTAFIGKWHMPGRLPDPRGVDLFITFTIQAGQGRYWKCPLIVQGVEVPARKPYITEDLTDYALEFLEKERDAPFCLYLSHKAVHHEWRPPPDMVALYGDVKPKLPKEADSWVTMTRGSLFFGTMGKLEHHYMNYARCVAALDRQIGRVLDKLDELGLADNTLVVYAGDNGFFWGEHRLVDKRWPYEESIRVPWIVRYPAFVPDPGRRAGQMVLNIDLAPTLLEAAGVEIPPSVEGRSFLPVLRSADAAGREQWLYEYFKDFPYNVPGLHAVRTGTHIYVEYQSRRAPELYDLIRDPHETNNLIGTAGGERLRQELKGKLEALKRGEGL